MSDPSENEPARSMSTSRGSRFKDEVSPPVPNQGDQDEQKRRASVEAREGEEEKEEDDEKEAFDKKDGEPDPTEQRKQTRMMDALLRVVERGYLQPLCLLRLQPLHSTLRKRIDAYFKKCTHFDFSYFFGIIGNMEGSQEKAFLAFCDKFQSLRSVEFKYCGNLKSGLLDRTLERLQPTPPIPEEAVNVQQIEHLNLFFCYDLAESACQKLVKRLPHLRELNLGRCDKISEKTRFGLQALGSLKKLERLVLTIAPFINKDLCWEIQNVFINKDNFPQLKELDLQGSISWDKFKIDTTDIAERYHVHGPKYSSDQKRSRANMLLTLESEDLARRKEEELRARREAKKKKREERRLAKEEQRRLAQTSQEQLSATSEQNSEQPTRRAATETTTPSSVAPAQVVPMPVRAVSAPTQARPSPVPGPPSMSDRPLPAAYPSSTSLNTQGDEDTSLTAARNSQELQMSTDP